MHSNNHLADQSIVVRTGPTKGKYHIRGIEDMPLTKRELTILLHTNLIPVEEIGIMFTELERTPWKNEAHFGIMGEFLYLTNYIPQKS